MKTELRDKLVSLEAGESVSYEILEEIEKSDKPVEVHNYYSDSTGFIEGWRIGDKGEIVVNCLHSGEPIVRKTQHVEDEVIEVEELSEEEMEDKVDNAISRFKKKVDSLPDGGN